MNILCIFSIKLDKIKIFSVVTGKYQVNIKIKYDFSINKVYIKYDLHLNISVKYQSLCEK